MKMTMTTVLYAIGAVASLPVIWPIVRPVIWRALFDPVVYAGAMLIGAMAVLTKGFHVWLSLEIDPWRWPLALAIVVGASFVLKGWSKVMDKAELNSIVVRLQEENEERDELNYWLRRWARKTRSKS